MSDRGKGIGKGIGRGKGKSLKTTHRAEWDL